MEPEQAKKKKIWKIIGAIIAVFAIIFVILLIFRNKTDPYKRSTISDTGQLLSNGKCEGKSKPKITHLPMREDDFDYVIPYGQVIDSHVTPIDHQYFQPVDFNSSVNTYPVYAMADAKLVSIEKRQGYKNDTDIRLVFSMSCKLFYYYDLVTGLVPEIEKELGGRAYAAVDIPVKGGQQIGAIGGRTLDFAVWDMDVRLPQFLVPEHYQAEPWKIHTADPLLFYTDDLKNKTIPKYLRTAEPASGKIDYDIDSRLIGSWFLEGTGGFGTPGAAITDNYKGHLSIIPDHLDPTSFVFSIGDYQGKPAQFGLYENGPDPSAVNVESGLVKYQLVQLDWIDEAGKKWDRQHFAKGLRASNSTRVVGVALISMLEARKLKLEVFPGKTAPEVSGFTNDAKVYER